MGKRSRSRSRSRSRRERSRRDRRRSSSSSRNRRRSRSRNRADSDRATRSTHGSSASSTTSSHLKNRPQNNHHYNHSSTGGRLPSRVRSPPAPIPSTAPRLQVPNNLPVEVRCFVDLFCQFVVQGGPGFEEEIREREKDNPFFAFLSVKAKWNDPIVVYYRWRLYAMLQEGQRRALTWRTEPYQLEEGPDQVLWVPPPVVLHGVEFLAQYADHFSVWGESYPQGSLSRWLAERIAKPTSIGSSSHLLPTQSAPSPPPPPPVFIPAIEWTSRVFVNSQYQQQGQQAKFLKTLRKQDVAWVQEQLSFELDWQAAGAAAAATRKSSGDEKIHTRAQLRAFQRIILSKEHIAQRCHQLLQRGGAASLNVVSILVDALTAQAGLIAAACGGLNTLSRVGVSSSDSSASRCEQQEVELEEEWARLSALVVRLLLQQWSLLFLLNDIGCNPEEAEDGRGSAASAATSHVTTAMDICATTVLECLIRSAWEVLSLSTLHATTMTTTEQPLSPTRPPTAPSPASPFVSWLCNELTGETFDAHTPVDPSIFQDVSVFAQVPLRSPAVDSPSSGDDVQWWRDLHTVATQLLAWTKAVVGWWGRNGKGTLPPKAVMKLEYRYNFLLCKPLEQQVKAAESGCMKT